MKPTLLRAAVILAALAAVACSPSPYYSSGRSGLAPGAVPRDDLGRPVLNGKAIEYSLPPAATTSPLMTGVTAQARPRIMNPTNQIIYYEDLRYADRPPVAAPQPVAQGVPPLQQQSQQ